MKPMDEQCSITPSLMHDRAVYGKLITDSSRPALSDPRSFDEIVKQHLDTCPGHSDPHSQQRGGYMERLRFLALACAGEAGEIANEVKKEWRGDKVESNTKLEGEIADTANYISMLAAHLQFDVKDQQRAKFLVFEQRPEWTEMLEKEKAS